MKPVHPASALVMLALGLFGLFVVVLALLGMSTSNLGAASDTATSPACVQGFPESFYVSTGTTVPSTDGATPIAQSGGLFVNGRDGQVRIDQFYLGQQHSFIADRKTHRAYMFASDVPGSRKGGNANCHVFSTVGDTIALCIPTSFTHDTTASHIVRGVPVERFHGFDRQDGPLLQVDYYVLNVSLTGVDGIVGTPLLVPWRMQTRERPAAELKEIAGAPLSMPNWRFFGQPMFDEVDFPLYQRDPAGETEVTAWRGESGPVTVDFYNFVPATPDAAVFTIPEACRRVEEAWEANRADGSSQSHPSDYNGDADRAKGTAATATDFSGLLRLSVAHRMLIDWSVYSMKQSTQPHN